MANKLYFNVSDKLVIDGNEGLSVDLAVDWNDVELASPLSVDSTGKVHPFVTGETFIGILSNKLIKNTDMDVAGVNVIEASYLKGGYYFWVRAKGTVALGDALTPDVKGFKKATGDDKIVGYAVSAGADGEAIRIRGGNY